MTFHVVSRSSPLPLIALQLLLGCGGAPSEHQLQQPTGARLVAPAVVEFPPTTRGATSAADVRLRNEGDEALSLVLEMGENDAFSPERRALEIAPGEETEVRLFFDSSRRSPGAVEGVARLRGEGLSQAMILRATSFRTCDPCSLYTEDRGCVAAPDGMACGTATECSDGRFCEAGACRPAEIREGLSCHTACDSPGHCVEARCVQDGAPEAPSWSVPLQGSLVIAMADEAGVILQIDEEGDWGWARIDPEGRRRWFHPHEGRCDPWGDDLLLCEEEPGWTALDPRSGDILWTTALPIEWHPIHGEHLVGSWTEGPFGLADLQLAALDRTTGAEVWRVAVGKRMRSVLASEAIDRLQVQPTGDELRVVGSRDGAQDRSGSSVGLIALDGATGKERWAERAVGSLQNAVTDESGRTFVSLHMGTTVVDEEGTRATRGRQLAWSSTGEILWHEEKVVPGAGAHIGIDYPVLAAAGVVFLGSGKVLDAQTGATLYQQPVLPQLVMAETVGRVLGYRASTHLVSFDLGDGTVQWSQPLPPARRHQLETTEGDFPLHLVMDHVAQAKGDRTICALDEDRRILHELTLWGGGTLDLRRADDRWYRTRLTDEGDRVLESWPAPRLPGER